MTLPENDQLAVPTLAAVFADTTNSYKFYWLLAILDSLREHGNARIPLRELSLRMVSAVWYPLDYFKLSFGKQDGFLLKRARGSLTGLSGSEATRQPLLVSLPPYTEDIAVGLRAAVLAAWLDGHVAPTAADPSPALKPGDWVWYQQDVWEVEPAGTKDAPPTARIRPVLGGAGRTVATAACRKLAECRGTEVPFPGVVKGENKLRIPAMAGKYYEEFDAWRQVLRDRHAVARRVFRLTDTDTVPRPVGGWTIIVAPGTTAVQRTALLEELPGAPIKLVTRHNNGLTTTTECGLPFVPSIHIVNTWAEAEAVRKRWVAIKQWHLVAVGRSSVSGALGLAALGQELAAGRWASVAVWGTDLGPTDAPGCTVWAWAPDEVPTARPNPDPVTLHRVPPDDTFTAAVSRVRTALTEQLTDRRVAAGGAWGLLAQYLRFAQPASDHDAPALTELIERTTDYFQSDTLADAFAEAGQDNAYREARRTLNQAFRALADVLRARSPKHTALTALVQAALTNNERVIVVADREYLVATRRQWTPLRDVEVRPLLGPDSVAALWRAVGTSRAVSGRVRVIVPFLFGWRQLALLRALRLPVDVLLHTDLEDGLWERTEVASANWADYLRRAAGRQHVLGVAYERLAPVGATATIAGGSETSAALQQLDFFRQLYEAAEAGGRPDGTDVRRPGSTTTGQLYEVTFADGHRADLDGGKQVLCREADAAGGERLTPGAVAELTAGTAIVLYENDQREMLYELLLREDQTGIMRQIEDASACWQAALRQLRTRYKSEATLHADLMQKGEVELELQSVNAYLLGKRHFPQSAAVLNAIVRLAEWHELANCPLLAYGALANIHVCQRKYRSLTITLGKGVADDVLYHRLTGRHGPVLALLEPALRDALLRNAKDRTVLTIRRKSS